MKIYKITQYGLENKEIGEELQTYKIIVGNKYLFEYHCYEGHDSCDANLWYHSHQIATVLEREEDGVGKDERERGENGLPACYRVRFSDGLEHTAMEDELMTSKKEFIRSNPPKGTI
jgi:hypothetical protein